MNELRYLSPQQQLVHIAMFTPVDKLPNFPPSITVAQLCDTITKMVHEGEITRLWLDKDGLVCVKKSR